MQSRWNRWLALSCVFGLWLAMSVGCAQERPAINQVQADALSKHFFIGPNLSDPTDDPEFYMRNTVIDVPFGASQDGLFTATAAQPLNRIKWEIQLQYLIARQTYEAVQNSDGHGSVASNNGQVVAMFNITTHFDIKRSYNPQTGEELNLITENTTDRPWYEREYFRVDWSKNLVTDGYAVDTLSRMGITGGIAWDAEGYYISDPSDPNAPHFEQDQGYFDVTTKAFATPQIISTPFGDFPACFLPADSGGSNIFPVANCNPTEVTLRLSFKQRVDDDYEPVDWDGNREYAFGWFTVDRYGYDRNYGVLDDDWHRFAARYNIWQQSHVTGSECAVDYWRDASGNVLKYQVASNGQFFSDASTGLPVPADPNDATAQPFVGPAIKNRYPASNVGLDVHRDTDGDGTEDACEFKIPEVDANGNPVADKQGNPVLVNAYPGSRCDEFTNKCDLPLYSRNIKTIPWYFGPDSDPTLFASTAIALGQWNLAVKRAAQIGKVVEAQRVRLDATTLQYPPGPDGMPNKSIDLTTEAGLNADAGNTVPDVFVLCHSPTIASDPPACTPNGTQISARLGDIRYNFVDIIPTPQIPSPWGIMSDADDPLTGEKIATSVNEWGAVLDIATQNTEDLLRWINGEITDQQIASGQYLQNWAAASKLGISPQTPPTLSSQEIASRLASIDKTLAQLNGLTPSEKAAPPVVRQTQAGQNLQAELGASLDSAFEGVRQQLIGSKFEEMLATPTMLQAVGMDPQTPVAGNDAVLAQVSSLRGMNPRFNAWVQRMKSTTMEQLDTCEIDQPEPDSLVGLARQATALYGKICNSHGGVACNKGDLDQQNANYPALYNQREANIHQWIRDQFHIAVIAHEMGHSMGLRHNFTGSYDALNYHPEYWQLRTQNGKEHFCVTPGTQFNPWTAALDVTDPHSNGADCVGPRWVDPVTDTEVNGLVWRWGSSTVMDYPGDPTQDMNDIGLYDKAAMRFGYADVVDMDMDAKLASGGPKFDSKGHAADKATGYLLAQDGFGGIGGQFVGFVHYSTYNDKYNLLGTCTAQTDPTDPLSATCSGPPMKFEARRDLLPTFSKYGIPANNLPTDLLGNLLSYYGVDKEGYVRHPYMFGSDEFADIGNVPVFRFDAGADSYEQFQFLTSTYENRYIFDNFRRDRTTFSTFTQINRDQSRYFDKIQSMTKSLALLVGLGESVDDPGFEMSLALGASDGFAMFARILTRPEPGPYQVQFPSATGMPLLFAQQQTTTQQIEGLTPDFQVALGAGEGRYLFNDYDYTKGYYWASYQTQMGSYYEKRQAIYYLTEAYNEFISNSPQDYIDGRYKNLNYSSLYPNQMRRLFAQVMQNDPMTMGPFIILQPGASPLSQVGYLPWEKYTPGDPTTVSLDYAQGAVVLDPQLGWEEQYPGLVMGFFFGPTTLTMNWVDQMRIYSPGGGDTVSIPPSEQIRYRDPGTGLEYVARNYGTEIVNSLYPVPVQTTAGARMLQYANRLAQQTFVVTATDPVTGELTYETDTNGNAVCTNPTSVACVTNTATLAGYSANLDIVRQLGFSEGYGPLGHCLPNIPNCQ